MLLKTIFARIGNNDSSIKALEQIGISVKTAGGEAKSASDLIGEVAEKWDTLSDAQRPLSIAKSVPFFCNFADKVTC